MSRENVAQECCKNFLYQQGCVKEQLQDSGKILNKRFRVGRKQNK